MKVFLTRLIRPAFAAGVLLFAGSGSGSGSGSASTEFTRADLDGLQKKLQSSESLRVELVQKKISPSRPNRPVVVKGYAMFQKPDRFRWVLGEPLNEETIFNGKDLFKYLPKDKVAARYSAKGQQAKEVKRVVDFVLNVGSIFNTYKLISGKREGKITHLQFKPANPETDEIETLEMTIDEELGFVSRVYFALRNKASLGVDFTSPDRRVLVPATFALPSGVKVNDIL